MPKTLPCPIIFRYNDNRPVPMLRKSLPILLTPFALYGADIDFSREVLPILSNKCFVCHGPDTKKKDLVRLDSFEAATKDLGGYQAINPKKPEESEFLARIDDQDDPMPPKKKGKPLTSQEKAILSKWIKQGGQYSAHWAFIPPQKGPLPANGNPIDAFVGNALQKKNLDFAPVADKPTLARRAALVLTGLPPESDQLQNFLADKSVNAYEKYVETLLASPRYGEHQARYWLDAIRYGDTHGLHLDNKRGIYPYRDWVVRAFNQNLPLDDFLTWQLAGDLLPDPTLEQLVATGFVRMNPTTGEGGAISEEFQAKNNFDRTETFGTVLLGLTLNCARCHSHKYDPVPQEEYYRLFAYFNNTAEPALDRNKYDYGDNIKAPSTPEQWAEYYKHTETRKKILSKWDTAMKQVQADFSKGDEIAKLKALAAQETFSQVETLRKEAEELQKTIEAMENGFSSTLVARELPNRRETRLLARGEYDLPKGDPLTPRPPIALGALPEGTPDNRLGLAQWATSKQNPLVSRVLTNQIWIRVFGSGLVRTPEDFGSQGQQPTHPELLDWLAVDLQDSGWDQKKLIRTLVTSRTFKQSSAIREDINDPGNLLLARGPSYRLDAEILRDTGLWASGLLDPTIGGEGVKPPQPEGMWKALAHPGSNTKNYVADKGSKVYRRSLYVYWKRTSPHPMMTLFDAPSRETSCVQRSRTNTPLQSLGLFNETQRVEMADALAKKLILENKEPAKRLPALFNLLICREPSTKEAQACKQLLENLKSQGTDEQTALAQLASTFLASDLNLRLY